jgi:hypothetical protein
LKALTTDEELKRQIEKAFKVSIKKSASGGTQTPSVWDRFVLEIFRFLCTKNPTYRELRKAVNDKSLTAGLLMVGAEIGAKCGTPAAGSAVAYALAAVMSVGKTTACATLHDKFTMQGIPLGPNDKLAK